MDAVWTTDLLTSPPPEERDDWTCATVSVKINNVGPVNYGWLRNERTKLTEYFVYVITPWGPLFIFNVRL